MPRITPEERQKRIVEAARVSILKDPLNIRKTLDLLYETAQSDFRTTHFSHQEVEGEEVISILRVKEEKWNPPMWGGGKK